MMHVWPGIGDPMALSGPRFFRLAYRLPCYARFTSEGVPFGTVLATRLAASMREDDDGQSTTRSAPSGWPDVDDRTEVPLEALVGSGEIVRG